jgi:palmitoyl-protein thioesterase
MGVSDIPPCRPGDFLCEVARRAVKGGVYSSWAQNNLVQVRIIPCVLVRNLD